MSHSPTFIEQVNAAKAEIKELDIKTVNQWLQANRDFKLIDVREDSEWAQARIPNAIHIGKGVIERDIESVVPDKTTEIVLYCGGGFRSAIAAKSLQDMGYNNVYSMAGGIRDWHEKSYILEV